MNAGKEIYIVSGSHGEYSDYETWKVAAFTDGVEADAFVEVLRTKLSEALEANREAALVYADLVGAWRARQSDDRLAMPDELVAALPTQIQHLAEDPSGQISANVHYDVEPVPLNPTFCIDADTFKDVVRKTRERGDDDSGINTVPGEVRR